MARKKTKAYKSTPFSERIAYLRKKAGYTMTILSEKMDVTPSYISLLESGERQASRNVVQKMADVFFEVRDVNARDELLMLAGLSPVQTDKIITPSDVRSSYEQSLTKNPQDFRIYGALIRHLLKERHVDEARYKIHEGMRRFSRSYQLQALLAHLELSHQHFRGAESAQLAAIEQFKTSCSEEQLIDNPDYADLYTNLGVIFFLWGLHYHDQEGATAAEHQEHQRQAKAYFERSKEYYRQAVSLAPKDMYILNEYARLASRLAELSSPEEQDKLWENAIEAHQSVLACHNIYELGTDAVRLTCLSLAKAYMGQSRLAEAELTLTLTRSLSPHHWPTLYDVAVFYAKRGKGKQGADFDKALEYLQLAAQVKARDNNVKEKVHHDPDLQVLRQKRSKAFNALFGPLEAEEK